MQQNGPVEQEWTQVIIQFLRPFEED